MLLSAVSDLEVENEERDGTMWHILYPFSDGPQPDAEGRPMRGMHIATTRPETMLADGALAVHPDDDRYRHLIGKMVDLPLCDRRIPVIADAYVDREFGSGCVKITGAHDFNDYAVALRHGLPLITIFTLDAKINENGPAAYQGLDRYDARKAVLADLEAQGFLEKAVPHQHAVPLCVRTGQVVEPMLTDQWFVAMTKPGADGTTIAGTRSVARSATEAASARSATAMRAGREGWRWRASRARTVTGWVNRSAEPGTRWGTPAALEGSGQEPHLGVGPGQDPHLRPRHPFPVGGDDRGGDPTRLVVVGGVADGHRARARRAGSSAVRPRRIASTEAAA